MPCTRKHLLFVGSIFEPQFFINRKYDTIITQIATSREQPLNNRTHNYVRV